MADDLRRMSKQERILWSLLESFEDFLHDYDDVRDHGSLQPRLTKLDEAYEKFCDLRVRIEMILEDLEEESEDGDDKKEVRKRESKKVYKGFVTRYFSLKQQLLSKMESIPAQPTQSSVSDVVLPCHTKYPELQLPTFSGKLLDWINFRDNFKSLIHDNVQLNDMDKFNYLRTSLRDDALLHINQIQVSAMNYGLAWSTLESKYENHKLIAQEHLKALLATSAMRTESYEALNVLLSTFKINLQQLEKLGQKTSNWSTLLAFMLSQKLDAETYRLWETHHASKTVPTYEAMVEFLENHCSILQSTASRSGDDHHRNTRAPISHSTATFESFCPICNNGRHKAEQCNRLIRMRVIDRKVLVRRMGLCLNCLDSGHFVADCMQESCLKCGQYHHVLLHPYSPNQSSQQNMQNVSQDPRRPQRADSQTRRQPYTQQAQSRMNSNQSSQNISQPTQQPPPTNTPTLSHHTSTLLGTRRNTHTAILSTAVVMLSDSSGNKVLARALLDNGSQISLMTEHLSQKLKFVRFRENLPVKGVGGSIHISKESVLGRIVSRTSSFKTDEIKFFVLPRITIDLPQRSFDVSAWNLPSSIRLADPRFNESSSVDLVIGVSTFYELLLAEQMKITDAGPILQNTQLGWIVAGEFPETPVTSYSAMTPEVSTDEVLQQLTKFWELESCRTKSCLSIEESTCEDIFNQTTTRDPDGKLRVFLPKREFMIERLGNSKRAATKRFLALENRLKTNLEVKALYTAFIHEYQLMGHMREVHEVEDEPAVCYYLPHQPVMKPSSTTTKLRVVFDASCSTSSGVSLNDILMVGPVVQDDLIAILLRFRIHKYAIVGDIEKMYRMVNVHEKDQPLQRILWRESSEEPLRTYQLTTVTYGTSSAPYLATRCLLKCAEDGKSSHPDAAVIIKKNFYVDDMLAGAHTIDEGKSMCKSTVELLNSYGFCLRKLNSNHPDLLRELPAHLCDKKDFLDVQTGNSTIQTLGLTWEPAQDLFWFKLPVWKPVFPVTFRLVLSDTARLFDPYGFAGPVIVQAKMFLQELWKEKYSWDEPLKDEHQQFWLEFRDKLNGLDGVSIPRWIAFRKDVIACEIHGFCDASEKAYGAAIYLRNTTKDGEVTIRLVTAKSKVAPLDDVKGKKRKQTIANRVSEIQHITRDGIWNHVPGIENPADIISRGLTPAQLAQSSLWWNGPEWLAKDSKSWPQSSPNEQQFDSVLLEEKPLVCAALQILSHSEIFGLKESLLGLVRLTAWMRRFAFNCRHKDPNEHRIGVLKSEEHKEALLCLVKIAQSESFPVDIADLVAKNEVKSSSRILPFHPIMKDGVLCVGGRLRNAAIPEERKHPMLLDNRHPLTKLVFVDYHHRLLHGGPQLMMASVRERFWPIAARNLAREVVHSCVRCFRARPRVHEQLMGDLPMERVSPAPVFQRVGVDYCGPFEIKAIHRKGAMNRCYVCVFVCLVVKAVHVEVVADLSTGAFVAAFRRFTSRRGRPVLVMCDNGTNFVGARRELNELHRLFTAEQFRNSVVTEAASEGIEFKFIPPRSPNFGGLWQQVQAINQLIWKRWSTDYLSQLQSRNKWTRQRSNLHIGTMVLLKEDNLPPLEWKLGRVTNIQPGSDGNIRVVTVRTQYGEFTRGISKICILPIRDNQPSENPREHH
ncbi:uncharacterized protein LOC129741514 [Uranotaenia lowii]|uniref:uncharacterized protein LOC129741514 n=1 Tax=Uranotaenia lowii TaxID=190385 RepID=UPI002479B8C6|nr:uncharacterized protein LOC129741514 [Uranotaenia lowii]